MLDDEQRDYLSRSVERFVRSHPPLPNDCTYRTLFVDSPQARSFIIFYKQYDDAAIDTAEKMHRARDVRKTAHQYLGKCFTASFENNHHIWIDWSHRDRKQIRFVEKALREQGIINDPDIEIDTSNSELAAAVKEHVGNGGPGWT